MRGRRASTTTGLLAALFVALFVLITSCGSDDTGTAPSTTTGATSTSTTGASATTRATSTTATTTLPPATTAVATTVARNDIKRTDWLAQLRATPGFSVDTTSPNTSPSQPYINISYASTLSGYAVLDSITYGDISGDGFDEAIVAVYSGGTAGNTGLLVYQQDAANRIALVGPNEFYTSFGYKTNVRIDNGDLVVGNVASAGWEPNCCQSGFVERRFRVVNGRLAQQGQAVEGGYLGARGLTIEHFYSLINEKNFDTAYQFTTPAFQAREPFDKWKNGYASTKSVVAESTPNDQAGPVKFKLTAVDTTPSGDLTRTYTGVWTLEYSTAKHQWLLDRAEVQLGS
jgi:hypothetical protein